MKYTIPLFLVLSACLPDIHPAACLGAAQVDLDACEAEQNNVMSYCYDRACFQQAVLGLELCLDYFLYDANDCVIELENEL